MTSPALYKMRDLCIMIAYDECQVKMLVQVAAVAKSYDEKGLGQDDFKHSIQAICMTTVTHESSFFQGYPI